MNRSIQRLLMYGLCVAALIFATLGICSNAEAQGRGRGGYGGAGYRGGYSGYRGGYGGYRGGYGGYRNGYGGNRGWYGGGPSFGIGFGGYGGLGYLGFGYPGVGSGYGGVYPGYRNYYYGSPAYSVAPRYGYPRRAVGRTYVQSPQSVDSGNVYSESPSNVYRGPVNERGEPTGDLRPGMVLPDGSVIVGVGN